jgi:hypothetical protein
MRSERGGTGLAGAAGSPASARRHGLDGSALAGWIPALVAFAVYARTAYRTVPFWDAGEYIATSYTLGIPHQP